MPMIKQRNMDMIKVKSGTAQGKIEAMQADGIHVCENPGALGELCADVFE